MFCAFNTPQFSMHFCLHRFFAAVQNIQTILPFLCALLLICGLLASKTKEQIAWIFVADLTKMKGHILFYNFFLFFKLDPQLQSVVRAEMPAPFDNRKMKTVCGFRKGTGLAGRLRGGWWNVKSLMSEWRSWSNQSPHRWNAGLRSSDRSTLFRKRQL